MADFKNVNQSYLRNENVVDDAVSTETSWAMLTFADVEAATRLQFSAQPSDALRDDAADILNMSQQQWNVFYGQHKNGFFQKRSYLHHVFPELFAHIVAPEERAERPVTAVIEDKPKIDVFLEAGCGTGSSLFSIADLLPNTQCAGFDLSQNAIDLVDAAARERADAERFLGFVWDPTHETFPDEGVGFVQPGSVDAITAIFMLSAVDPAKQHILLERLLALLRPGGRLYFRDYGLYDMTMLRFHSKKNKQLGPNLYVRGDGTTTYFFAQEDLQQRCEAAGFTTVRCGYDVRRLLNRKRKLTMYRVWTAAVFEKPT